MAEELQKEVSAESPAGENIEDLKKSLAEEKARAEANLAGWQRSQADFVNYKRFVEDRISYQRELSRIKELIIE